MPKSTVSTVDFFALNRSMPLDDFYNKIRILEDWDIKKESLEVIQENSGFITELLREQLSKGLDSKNEAVTIFGRSFYSDLTIWNKTFHGNSGLAKETGFITNYMSGDFYKSLFVTVKGEEIDIDSTVPYYDEILIRSGRVIMELSPENLQWFSEHILFPELEARFTTRFNGV